MQRTEQQSFEYVLRKAQRIGIKSILDFMEKNKSNNIYTNNVWDLMDMTTERIKELIDAEGIDLVPQHCSGLVMDPAYSNSRVICLLHYDDAKNELLTIPVIRLISESVHCTDERDLVKIMVPTPYQYCIDLIQNDGLNGLHKHKQNDIIDHYNCMVFSLTTTSVNSKGFFDFNDPHKVRHIRCIEYFQPVPGQEFRIRLHRDLYPVRILMDQNKRIIGQSMMRHGELMFLDAGQQEDEFRTEEYLKLPRVLKEFEYYMEV